MTLLVLFLLSTLASDVSRELARADPAGQAAILSALPERMRAATPAERKDLAPLLLRIVRDPDKSHLHNAAVAPLVATETAAGVGEVIRRSYSREAIGGRDAAQRALAAEGGGEVTRILAAHLARDSSERARAWLALILGRRLAGPGGRERFTEEAGKGLFDALSDPHAMVRAAAAESLTRMYRECHGYEPEGWRKISKRPPPDLEPAPAAPDRPEGDEPVTVAPARDPEKEVGRLVPEFHGIPLDRSVVVAVLDFSASVRGPGGEKIKRDLGRSLSLLPTIRSFTVIAFDQRLFTLDTRPQRALPDLKEELVGFLGGLPRGQRTELLMPLRTGLAMAEEYGEDGAQVLIVSDGAPTVAGPPLDDLVRRAKELEGGAVRVDAAVYGGRSVGLFKFLTRVTGGRYVPLPAPR